MQAKKGRVMSRLMATATMAVISIVAPVRAEWQPVTEVIDHLKNIKATGLGTKGVAQVPRIQGRSMPVELRFTCSDNGKHWTRISLVFAQPILWGPDLPLLDARIAFDDDPQVSKVAFFLGNDPVSDRIEVLNIDEGRMLRAIAGRRELRMVLGKRFNITIDISDGFERLQALNPDCWGPDSFVMKRHSQ